MFFVYGIVILLVLAYFVGVNRAANILTVIGFSSIVIVMVALFISFVLPSQLWKNL